MRFFSYEQNAQTSVGVLLSESATEFVNFAALGSKLPNDLKALIERPDGLATAYAEAKKAPPQALLPLKDVKFKTLIENPSKVVCMGLNYADHAKEGGNARPEFPSFFLRGNSSLASHNASLIRPRASDKLDYEAELALVISKPARHLTPQNALEYVAGYACFNDGTARDWQRHTHQWIPGKNFPLTGPFGPFMATTQEIPDVNRLTLETRLNGEVMQHASLADLIFTLPVIIEYISGFTPLSAGDVIATGTPGGVGDRREPPVYMKAGDVIEIEITGLGTLRNRVVDAA